VDALAQSLRCAISVSRWLKNGGHAALAEKPAPCHFPCMEWRASRPAKRPGIIEPCIPTRVSKPPVGPQWIHEIKHDGYRLIARKRDGRVRLFTRRGFDWTERYPRISAAKIVSGPIDRSRLPPPTPSRRRYGMEFAAPG
jgi:ATP-dependent DNA ligase